MRKDDITDESPGVPARRGRPPTGKAKDGAARQAAYRVRLKQDGKQEVTLSLPVDLVDALRAYTERKNADSAVQPLTLGDAAAGILRDRLLRKR